MDYTWQPRPTIISRRSWNADAATGCSGSNSNQYIIIHHSGDTNDAIAKVFGSNERGMMKRIQEIHMGNNGCDIGYNYGIGTVGGILEGRSINVRGAHEINYNSRSIGVFVHGNYDIRNLTSTQESSLVNLLAWLCFTHNISTARILAHKDVRDTDCPGSSVYSKLNSITTQVLIRLSPGMIK
ncbi:MAG: peptidoglycan recognition family protein [Alkaliphilus sp.]